jgi:hypothetical protein
MVGHVPVGFPIGAMVMIQVLKPDYYDDVKETAFFIPALSSAPS